MLREINVLVGCAVRLIPLIAGACGFYWTSKLVQYTHVNTNATNLSLPVLKLVSVEHLSTPSRDMWT